MCPEIDEAAIDRLLGYLPAFERGDFAQADSTFRATGRYLPEVEALTRAVYDSGLPLTGWNWSAWRDEASRYANDPELTGTADLDILRKLLTVTVRQDRFVGGLLPKLCSSGFLEAILRRLRDIHSGPGTPRT